MKPKKQHKSVPRITPQVKPGEPVVLCRECNHSLVDPVCEWPALPAHAVQSDYIPSLAESLHAKAALQAEGVVLDLYDAEMRHLTQAVEELREKRAALKERMFQRRAMVSIMRRVSTEIWDKILSMGCYPHDIKDDDPRNRFYNRTVNMKPSCFTFSAFDSECEVQAGTYTLSRVCKRWKAVLESRPELWSAIHINIPEINRDGISILRLYLKNSREAPLKVYLNDSPKLYYQYVSDREEDSCEETVSEARVQGFEAVRMVLKHASRFQDLIIWLLDETMEHWHSEANQPEPLDSFQLPLLRSFSSNIVINHNTSEPRWFWDTFRTTPSLNRLDVQWGSQPGLEKRFPCQQLTSLVLRFGMAYTGRELLTFLRECPKLESLSMKSLCWEPLPSSDTVAVELPLLRMFHLCMSDAHSPAHLPILLRALTFPALYSFGFEISQDVSDMTAGFETFLSRTRAEELKWFDFHNPCHFHAGEMLTAVNDCLVHLEVNLCGRIYTGKTDLLHLHLLTLPTKILPKLRTLVVKEFSCGLHESDAELFVVMVESRSQRNQNQRDDIEVLTTVTCVHKNRTSTSCYCGSRRVPFRSKHLARLKELEGYGTSVIFEGW